MSSAEPQKKLSKKAKLKLARERAAQFAQRDKEKIENRRGKKSGTVGPKVKTQNKLAKYESEEKHAETMTGTAVEKKSPKKKLSLTERRKTAMENAKKFAARDRAGLESKKKVARAVAVEAPPKYQQREGMPEKPSADAQKQKSSTPSAISESKTAPNTAATHFIPPQHAALSDISLMEVAEHMKLPSNTVYPSQLPGILPNHQNFGAAIDPNQVLAYERMRQMQHLMMQEKLAMEQQQQQKLIQQHVVAAKQKHLRADQLRLQAAATAQHVQSVIPPMNMAIPPESLFSGGNGDPSSLPPGMTVTDGKNGDGNNFVEEMNEEDMPPPPPALMAQVSQQVLFNAQNEEVDHANPVSIEGERQIGNNEVPHPEPIAGNNNRLQATKIKTHWFSKITSVIIICVAITSVILMLPSPSMKKTLSLADTMIPKEPLCYFNSDSEYKEGCSYNIGGIECPKGGVCEGGKLVACDNVFQDVSDQGDKCVLGESYFPMKAALVNQLVSHASQICDQSSKPNFKYAMLQKEQPTILEDESEAFVEALMDEGFVVHERDGLYVGLPEGFKVNLPIYCFLGNIGQWVLQEVGLLLLGILRFASSNLFGFVSAYPKLSALNLFVLICFVQYRKYRAAKTKRQEDISRTREIAYRTLEESCGVEHYAMHIRDEIAMALYPNSKKLRLQLQKTIWPKIVDDVKRDTRVRKFQTFNKDGKTRDMWQWSAARKTPIKA